MAGGERLPQRNAVPCPTQGVSEDMCRTETESHGQGCPGGHVVSSEGTFTGNSGALPGSSVEDRKGLLEPHQAPEVTDEPEHLGSSAWLISDHCIHPANHIEDDSLTGSG